MDTCDEIKYCWECGNKLELKECFNCSINEGLFPYCKNCEEFRFPFFNVAVSMVIYNKDYSKILLIKQYKRDFNILVAGYVNKKETLEEALIREIKEEVNLEVLNYKFNKSKYYPKSNSLICNFIMQVKNEDFSLTPEVDSAKWFSIDEAKREVMPNSLAQEFLNLSIEKINSKFLFS